MSSYVHKKIRAFNEAGDVPVQKKHSDGRMKTYTSATDARAWCDKEEERRQYILDLIRQGDGKGLSLGKYIPIEAIIDILLANKNADIKRLQKENEDLRRFIKDHGLVYVGKAVDEPFVQKQTAFTLEESDGTDGEGAKGGRAGVEQGRGGGLGEGFSARMAMDDGPFSDTGGTSSSPGFVSDSSDYETDKAAQELLAGKSPEEQLQALKDALAQTENFHKNEHAVAVAAIELLESIKDIVDGGDGKTPTGTGFEKSSSTRGTSELDSCKDEIESLEREIEAMKSKSSPEADIIKREVQVLKKYCAKLAAIQQENTDLKNERDKLATGGADNTLKEKLAKLNEVTQERDRLKARVNQLEQELKGYGNLPAEIETFKEKSQAVDSLRQDEDALRDRLNRLKGLDDEVKALRDRSNQMAQAAGDTTERDELLARIAELEKEAENCKCKLKELELLKVERNCLKMRVDDLAKIQQDYEDLLKKTQGFDSLKAECAMYKAKYEELLNLEAECNELRAKVQRAEELEQERAVLMKEIEDCECCMNNQENEIKRLACHIDCLTQDLDKRQDEMKHKVMTMRASIEKKDCLINRSEEQLADLQEQLRGSIEQLSCETTCLRVRIGELEDEVAQYEKALTEKEASYNTLETSYKNLKESCSNNEDKIRSLEEKNKSLVENLESEKNSTVKLEEALRKAIKSDEHLKQMLKQAKCAIKCITQKLEQHDIVGIGRLEAERQNYMKRIKELEEGLSEKPCGADKIEELQLEIDRILATNKDLLNTLEELKAENNALRTAATELQFTAKTEVTKLEGTKQSLARRSQEMEDNCAELREKLAQTEKIVEDLRNQIIELNRQVEVQKKRADDTEGTLLALTANGDAGNAEIGKLLAQINVLNAEIDRLHFDLQNEKKMCEEKMQKLRVKIEQLQGNTQAIKSLEDTNEDINIDVERYKKESELLKLELQKMKDFRDKSDSELDKLRGDLVKLSVLEKENADLKDEIKKLKEENNKLKEEIGRLKGELATKEALEKENKALKDQANKLKDSSEKESRELKQEISRISQEIEDKEGLKNENKRIKEELNRLKQEAAAKRSLEDENKSLKDEIDKLKQELASKPAGAAVAVADDKQKDYAKEKDDLLNQIAAQKKEIADLLNKIKEPSKSEDTSMFKELENKNKEIEALQKQLQELENKNKDLEKLLSASGDMDKVRQEMDNKNKENDKLKSTIEDLEKKLKECENRNKDNEKLLAASGDMDKVRQEMDNKNKEVDKLKSTIEDLEKRLKECENKNKDNEKLLAASGDMDKVRQEMDNKNRENDKLKSTIGDLEKKLKELENKNKDNEKPLAASGDMDKVRQEIDNKNKENDKLKSTIADLEKKLKDLENKNKDNEKLLASSGDMDKVRQEMDNKNKENDKLKSNIADLEKKLKELENKNKENEKLLAASGDMDKVRQEMDGKNKEIDKLKSTIADLEKKIKDLENKNQENQKLLAASGDTAKIREEMDNKNKEIDKLKSTIADLEKKLKELESKNKENEKMLAAGGDSSKMQEEINNKNKEIDKLKATIADLEKKVSELEAKNRDNETILATSGDLDKVRVEMDNKTKEIEQLKSTVADLKKQLEDAKNKDKENENLKATIASLEKQLKDLQQVPMDVPSGSPEIDKVMKSLRDSLEREEAKTRDLEANLRKAKQENDALKTKNSELEANLKKCQDSNDELKQKIDQLETENRNMKDDLAEKDLIDPNADVDENIKRLQAEMARRKQECNDMIASLKEQYDRDIKNLRKENEAAIDKLQKAHQEALDQVNAEHDGASAKLKQELKAKEANISKMKIEAERASKEPSVKATEPSVKEEEKPKNLTMKTFENVCICDKLPMVIPLGVQESPTKREAVAKKMPSPVVPCAHFGSPPCTPTRGRSLSPTSAEKVGSIKKIVELENRLLVKQEHTKQKINLLQSTVDRFKRELELERQKNNDLLNRYTNQSKTVANMRVEMDIVKRENFQDKKKLQHLNMTLKNIMEKESGPTCQCMPKALGMIPPTIPHFHTELSLVKHDNSVQHNCIMKRKSCNCSMGDVSSESFDIGPGDSNEVPLNENFENRRLKEIADKSTQIMLISHEKCKLANAELQADLAVNLQKIQELELQRDLFSKEVERCKVYIGWQRREIKRLSFHLESISSEMSKRERTQSVRTLTTRALNEKEDQNSVDTQELQKIIQQKDESNQILAEKLNSEINNNNKMKEAIKIVTKNCLISMNTYSQCKCNEEIKEVLNELRLTLKQKDQQIEDLETEREKLLEELDECEDYITNQVEEMKKLASCIDDLSQDSDRKEEISSATKIKVGKSFGKLCMCKQITQLKTKLVKHKQKVVAAEQNNKILLETLQNEKQKRNKVEETFSKMMEAYQDSVDKLQRLDTLENECEIYKIKLEEMKGFKAEAERAVKLQEENKKYVEEIEECKCHIKSQNDKINTLTSERESTIRENKEKEDHLRSTIQNMENYIIECEEKLSNVNNELQNSLQQSYSEKTCMCDRIEDLANQIEEYESVLYLKDENNKVLLHTIETQNSERVRMEKAFENMTQRDRQSQRMLAQATYALKSITQKLEEYDIERLEVQRDNQIKISELETQLGSANNMIKKLRENMKQMKELMQKNKAFRGLSEKLLEDADTQITQLEDANEDFSKKSQELTQMYTSLKQALYEKDKTFDELRNQLTCLRRQLEDEQKLRENTETVLAAGDSELVRLRKIISLLNREIDGLHLEIGQLMKGSTVEKLKNRVEKLEKENDYLKREVENLTGYLEAVIPGYIDPLELAKLKSQLTELEGVVRKQKREVETHKKMRDEMIVDLKRRCDENDEQNKRIKELIDENIHLKQRPMRVPGHSGQHTVIVVEKEKDKSGGVEYKCLYGTPKTNAKPHLQSSKVESLVKPTTSRKFEGQKEMDLDELKELKEQSVRSNEEINKLKGQLRILNMNKEDPEEVKKVRNQLAQATTEITALLEQLAIANAETDELKQKQKTDMSTQRDYEVVKITEEMNSLKNQLATLEKEREMLKHQLDIDVPKKLTEVDTLENENKTLKDQMRSVSENIGKLRFVDDHDALMSAISNLQNQLQQHHNLERELDHTKRENEELKSIVAQLETTGSFENLKGEYPKEPEEVEKVFNYLTQTLDSEQKKVIELEELWTTCEGNVDKLKRKNEELEHENEKLKQTVLDLRVKTRRPSATDAYMSHLNEVHEGLEKWENTIRGTVADVAEKIEKIGNISDPQVADTIAKDIYQRVDSLKTDLIEEAVDNKKKATLADLQDAHITELERQVRECNANNDILKDEIKNLEQVIEILKNDVVEGTRNEHNPDEDKTIGGGNLDLEEKLKDYEHKNQMLQTEVDRLRLQRNSLFALVVPKELPEKVLQQQTTESNVALNEHIRELERKLLQESAGGCPTHEALVQELENKCEHLEKKNFELAEDNDRLTKLMEGMKLDTVEVPGTSEDKKMRDLMEHLRDLQKRNEVLKTRTIQLGIENGKLKSDMERIMGRDHKKLEKELARLSEVEKQASKCQEKYQRLKKRLMKTEIENKNLKKDYIETLIAKEKLALLGNDQTKRLRETSKLLKKTQEKKNSLTDRLVKVQTEKENLAKQLEGFAGKEVENIQKFIQFDELIKAINSKLEAENENLRGLLRRLTDEADVIDAETAMEIRDYLESSKNQHNWQQKVITLENENENIRKELEQLKGESLQEMSVMELEIPSTSHNVDLRAVELQIENEFLKKELANRESLQTEGKISERDLHEIEDELHRQRELNDDLKKMIIGLELENEYMRNELERMTKLQENLQCEFPEKETKQKMHALQMKLDNLEHENKNLKHQLEVIGKQEMTLDHHTQHKLLREIEKLLYEYEELRDFVLKIGSGKGTVDEKLKYWKERHEPKLLNLKQDLDRLSGRDKNVKCEAQLRDCRAKNEKLEMENRNMKITLDILLKEKGESAKVKLVKEVEQHLKDYRDIDYMKRQINLRDERISELELQLEECEGVNTLLREEKISLASHVQDQLVTDLEALVQQYQLSDFVGTDPQRSLSKEALADTKLMKIRELDQKNQQLQKELQSLQSENEELKKTISNLEDETSKTRLKEKRVSFVQPSELKINRTLGECEEENETLKQAYAKLRKKYEESQKRITDLEEQLKKCREVNKDLKRRFLGENPEHPNEKKERDEKPPDDDNNEQETKTEEGPSNEETRINDSGQTQLKFSDAQIKEIDKLRKENVSLKNSVGKMKELEQRLGEVQSNYRGVKLEIERIEKIKSVNDELYERKQVEFERQFQEMRIENEICNVKLDEFRKELVSKLAVENENKSLKEEINVLRKKLASLEKDNKEYKNEINKLAQKKDDLVERNEKKNEEITELKQKIEFLEEIKDENEKLKGIIVDLQKQLQMARSNSEIGKGDAGERRKRKLEEIVLKYHDNCEYLKTTVMRLETERSNLTLQLNTHKEIMNESKERLIRKLEETLYKYKDSNENVGQKLINDEAQEKYVDKLDEQIQKERPIEDDNMKLTIAHLEAEIKYLKEDFLTFVTQHKIEELYKDRSKETQTSEIQKASKIPSNAQESEDITYEELTNELSQQKKKWKGIVATLTEQYEKNINLLNKKIQKSIESPPLNPWMVTPIQPPGFHSGYTTVPVMWQIPNDYHYAPAQNVVRFDGSEEGLQQLSDLINQIQYTLDKSKQVLESKGLKKEIQKEKNIEPEQEQCEINLETFEDKKDQSSAADTRDWNTQELKKHVMKQKETKEKIHHLQHNIKETMKELKEIKQKRTILVNAGASSSKTTGKAEFKQVVSRCIHGNTTYTVPHFHLKTPQKPQKGACPHVSTTEKRSSQPEPKKFDSSKK